MKHEDARLVRARALELGLTLSSDQVGRLLSYGSWLVEEAIPAGALGPGEASRVLERHVLDALAFGLAWPVPPERVVDVGSGAGLPGIPLAVAWPRSDVVLLERSGRRARLLRRAIRVLGLPSATVAEGDVRSLDPDWPAAVMRGVLPPDQAVLALDRVLTPSGRAVLAMGAGGEAPSPPPGRSLHLLENRSTVLARTVRLLIMAPL